MKTHSKKQFLEWAAAHRIQLDERYPDSAVLAFTPDPHLDRFWKTPRQAEDRPRFLLLMLELMTDWKSCFVWRHLGRCPTQPFPYRMNGRIEFEILRGIGLPMGSADIVEFERAETDRFVTCLFTATVFGGSVSADLYIVPDHAQQII